MRLFGTSALGALRAMTISLQGMEYMEPIASTGSVFSRDEKPVRGVMTKQSRSKYRPHYGAKEAAKYAARGKL